jgi:imidazolonepropionase
MKEQTPQLQTQPDPLPQGWDRVWVGASLATMDANDGIGEIADAALAVSNGRIAWIGSRQQLDSLQWSATTVTDARGLWITPGLIECHTHLVYGGDRSNEFAARGRD